MSDPKSFIARWSRRKRAATEDAEATQGRTLPVPQTPDTSPRKGEVGEQSEPVGGRGLRTSPRPDGGRGPAAESFDVANLPPIESITAETDIRAFLAPGVPPELTRAALRRAWAADPKIREFIGLSENAWDFNAPDAMAGFGPLEMTDELRRQIMAMVGRGLAEEAPDKPGYPPIEALGAQEKPATADQSAKGERISGMAQAPTDPNMSERSDPAPQPKVDHAARQDDAMQPAVGKRRHGRALPE